jgi:hypothetical protein
MVNADHTRPLVAFGLLALAAAVITTVGLQTNDSAAPIAASTASATSSGAPEVVLGDVLRARSDAVLTNPLSPGLWASGTATPSGGTVQVASPSGPTTTQKARTETGGTHQTTRAHATATTTTTSTPSTGHGKGRGKSSQPAKTTTATATTTDGKGKGRPADPGSGH